MPSLPPYVHNGIGLLRSERALLTTPGKPTPVGDSKGKNWDAVPADASFAAALPASAGSTRPRLPQAIAHRGYKAEYPENTMAAFRNAVAVGAEAIETDLHLSKDGVVVLSHDPSLKRVFGVDKRVADCEWAYLATLRTLREPREPMPRLIDLLEYLQEPGLENVWALLDIKRDDDANELVSRLAATVAAVPAKMPWNERLILGCWTANYVKKCLQHLPGYPLAYIGWSLSYARELLRVPNMNFNLFRMSIAGPGGARFLRDAWQAGRRVWVWTVNDEHWMEYSIRKGYDGVITDNSKLFVGVRKRWETEGAEPEVPELTVQEHAKYALQMLFFQVLAAIFAGLFLVFVGTPQRHVRRALYG